MSNLSRWRPAAHATTLLVAVLTGCNGPLLPRDYVNGSRVSSPTFVDGPAPRRAPSPERAAGDDRFEDSLTGGEVFQLYCAFCHNRRPMFERPFSNYQNVAAHMRTRANLSGKEYDKLVAWMRRMQDAELPSPDTAPSPKRLEFSQPVNELKPDAEAPAAAAAAGRPGIARE